MPVDNSSLFAIVSILGVLCLALAGFSIYAVIRWRPGKDIIQVDPPHSTGISNELDLRVAVPANENLVPIVSTEVEPVLQRPPNLLVVGTPDETWGKITRYVPETDHQLQEIPLTKEIKTGLGVWLQHAPTLATEVANASATTYVYKLAPELQQRIGTMQWDFMKAANGGIHGSVVGPNGQIVGNAAWYSTNGLRLATAVAATWQIMAVVTAQYFLIDINRQLEAIQATVKEIQGFLEDRERAALLGNIRYLRTIADLLNQQSLALPDTTAFLNQLEEIDRESEKALLALQNDLQKLHTAVEQERVNSLLGFHKLWIGRAKYEAFHRLITRYETKARVFLTAASVKCLAAQLRCGLSSTHDLAQRRFVEVKDSLSAWRLEDFAFWSLVQRRAPELKSRLSNYQSLLLADVDRLRPQLSSVGDGLDLARENAVKAVEQQLTEMERPLSIVAELGANREIKKAWRLLTA